MNRKDTQIPLVLSFTVDYFIPAATCIYSLLQHSQSVDTFHIICLLPEDLHERLKNKLKLLVGRRGYLTFLLVKDNILNGINVSKRYTAAAYYRLILTDLLPQYDKVIYMDCDIIVRNDIAQLYHTINLSEYYMAGVFEATLDFQEADTRAVGCEPGQYINSGFLIMNLAKLRSDNIKEIFLQTLKNNVLRFPDQDTVNMVCKGRILALRPYYNSIRTFFIPEYKMRFLHYYSETDWDAVQLHGTIHYTSNKPWKNYAVKFEVWWNYYHAMPAFIKQEMKKDITYWKLVCYSHFFNSYVGSSLVSLMKLIRSNVR